MTNQERADALMREAGLDPARVRLMITRDQFLATPCPCGAAAGERCYWLVPGKVVHDDRPSLQFVPLMYGAAS